nr:integrase, catalytic region, zinc finger, CCHC-type, peptidase aspartic, catalytic [Tanacetum cinerariifolium]
MSPLLKGPLLPVVIRELESGKYQMLPEVQGKGKEKVTDEQVPLDLLTLQTPKKNSPADQFIFQRRTSTPTGSSGHDESSSLYAELGLTDSEAVPNPGDAAASQPLSSFVVPAGSNLEHMDLEATYVSTQPHPKQMDEWFTATAYPKVQENLKLTVEEHVILEEPASSTGTLSSLQHLAKDLNFGDLFFNDKPSEADNEKITAKTEVESMVAVTIQQDTSSIPSVTTPIIDLTLRPDSLNHIGELEHIMANLIQDNKHLEERLDSHGARQYTLENLDIPQQVSKAIDKIVTDAVDWVIQASLRNRFRDLPKADMKEILHQKMWETNSYKTHDDHMMFYEALEKSMNRDHTEELLKDLAEARKKKKKRRDSPKMPPGSPPYQPPPPSPPVGPSRTLGSPGASGSSQVPPPPPPPPSTNQEGQSHGSAAPCSSKTVASAEYKAWTTTDTRLRLSVSSNPEDLQMNDDMAPDAQVHSSDDEDTGNAYIPKVNLQQDWWKPLEEDKPATPEPAWSIQASDLPVPKNNWASALASTYSPPIEDSLLAQTGDMAMFIDWICKRQGITKLKPQDLEGLAFELEVFHPNVIHLQYQMEECHKLLTDSVDDSIIRHNVSKPLPLGGPPSQVTIQSDFFFNKDLEYLRYGIKGSKHALSISKMKAAYYPDVGLEKMVPDQMWIDEECKYDIAAMYGISQWRFQRQQFYIDKHTSEGDGRAVRTHMRILSVVRIEVFSMYGYDYKKKIVLCRADLNEHIIAERDFKYLYPSDFEDLHLVIRQRVKDFQLGIESYQTQLNLTKPRWDATGFKYKHDYTVIDSPRAVTFWDRYGVQMIMRFNEIHKFSDGTLHQIDEALDYWVKEFKLRLALAFWSLRFGSAFCICVLLIEDISCILPREDSAHFKTWFRFVSRLPAFCLKTSYIFSQDLVAFCLKTSCVLSQDLLRFVSRLGCVLSQDLVAFYLKTYFVSRLLAFCLLLKTFFCVLMLLEGSELTKEDQESQLYDDFEHFRQHKGETIHDYYVRFAKLINDMRNIKMTMSRIGQETNPWGGGAAGYGGVQNRVGNANPGQARQVKCYNCNADDCDAFDSDVDEASMAQTMFVANLSSANPVNDEAGPSYDSDILSEYVKDNAVPVVHSNVSSVPNDEYMIVYNDMYEPHAQSVSKTSRNTVVENSLTAELATYKEQVELYERRARFELTEREHNINEQLRLVISDRNFKEETLKKELHSVKLQLALPSIITN